MTEVFEVIRAENAPTFVPAGQLAFVTGRVDRDGDWDTAGQELITELRANPWRLEPLEGTVNLAPEMINSDLATAASGGISLA
ncbi:MAG: hypothetical protein WCF33_16655 [Pseudonocardiaceae bacterium]